RVEDRRSIRRAAKQRGVLVDELMRLVGVEQKITDFADPVLVLQSEGRPRWIATATEKRVINVVDAATARVKHVFGPGQIEVPTVDRPQTTLRVAIVEIVFVVTDIVVV